jgi:aspartyl-tRNA(Asn)/glutamyl-tRNA(Gln) amidotransferase subunit B
VEKKMDKYIVTIGLEIHTELNTKSKMFSSSINSINAPINTDVNEIDLGLPGILPSPNKEAIIKAIKLCKALNMKIDPLLRFDRKNYFYQDLPKGYQITQQYYPIGKNGKLNDVSIQRLHLEEDTAKQFVVDNKINLDYNRAGIPLIEIVSEPVIHSSKQAIDFLIELRNILIFCDISDGKMEEGSFRVDVNISLAKDSDNELGTKVEIKNINSFANVVEAIDFEIKRQSTLLQQNKKITQETRR